MKEVLKKISRYKSLLERYNQSLNLYSRSLSNFELKKHIIDCIYASRVIYNDCKLQLNNFDKRIFDIGSGNGLPGIIFSILYPDITVHLYDTDQRKCAFLKSVVHKLSLNATVVNKTYLSIEKKSIFVSKAFMRTSDLKMNIPKESFVYVYTNDNNFQLEIANNQSASLFLEYSVLGSVRYIEKSQIPVI